MQRAARLNTLSRRSLRRCSRFERRARLLRFLRDDSGNTLDSHQIEAELGALVINIQSYWSNWCRAFYLSAAIGTQSASGTAVSSALVIGSEHDALTIAITRHLHPPHPPPAIWLSHQEPKWFAPDILSRILLDAQINTASFLTSLLNSGAQALSDLRTFRNYYAHRSEPLKRIALQLGPRYLVGRPQKPSDILLFVEPMHTVSVLERIVLDISRLTAALCS